MPIDHAPNPRAAGRPPDDAAIDTVPVPREPATPRDAGRAAGWQRGARRVGGAW